jgi:hypothetical protein
MIPFIKGFANIPCFQQPSCWPIIFTWEMFTKPHVLKLATFLSQKWFENAPKTFVTCKLFADAMQTGPERFYYPPLSSRVLSLFICLHIPTWKLAFVVQLRSRYPENARENGRNAMFWVQYYRPVHAAIIGPIIPELLVQSWMNYCLARSWRHRHAGLGAQQKLSIIDQRWGRELGSSLSTQLSFNYLQIPPHLHQNSSNTAARKRLRPSCIFPQHLEAIIFCFDNIA